MEEELAPSLGEREIAELVHDDEVEPCDEVGEPTGLPRAPFVANGALKEPLTWHFVRNDFERRTIRMHPAMSINTTPAVLAATLAGAGLSVLPDFLVADALATGRLVNILPDWSLPAGGIHIVYPTARFRPPKVTAFVDMLVHDAKQPDAQATA